MKDSYYFPHDYHARHDPKLEKLRLTMGCEGVGIFWCLVEMLYEENGYLKLSDLNIYSKSLNTDSNKIKEVIEQYGLFEITEERLYSVPLLKRLEHLTIKRQKARESINARWNTNVIRTNNEGNTRKESKVKESIKNQGTKTGFLSEREKQTVLKDISLKNGVGVNSESAQLRLEELSKEVAAIKDVKNPIGLIRHKARNQ